MNTTMAQIERVIGQVENHIAAPRREEYLSRSAVEAIDVVYHALAYTGHPRALEIWRTALWHQRLDDDGRAAVATMLDDLSDEIARGNTNAAAEICDCLTALVPAAADPAVAQVPDER